LILGYTLYIYSCVGLVKCVNIAGKAAFGVYNVLKGGEKVAIGKDAKVVLAWCAVNTHEIAVRFVLGKQCPTIWLNWNGLARSLGYDADCREATIRSLAALNELKAVGLLASFDEGPNCFGHSTLCFVPQG